LSPSTKRLLRLLADSPAPLADWRRAWRLAFAQLRTEVDLHPRGATPSAQFEAAAHSIRMVAEDCLPLGMGLAMHLYPLGALRGVPLPCWSAANLRRQRLVAAIDREGLILANAGSERVSGSPSPLTLTRSRGGLRIDGRFDYVSLASVADLVLFHAQADGASVFCMAQMMADTVRLGTPCFSGTLKLSDTSSITFEGHLLPANRFVMVPNASALNCMSQYQRAWFQLLACEAHLARLQVLRRRWQLPRAPVDIAGDNELRLMREYALRLLDDAARVGAVESLSRVTAALKLRVSWLSQSVAANLQERDAVSAAELAYLKRQPTSDERILHSLSTATADFTPVRSSAPAPRADRAASVAC
jgi:alkylation response protein AidB-like acyl-CoA dehydrogenase